MRDKEQMKKVSVVMATCNGENFLNKQMDSILAQTMIPDEIIVVDDQSTDNTMNILNAYAKRFECVKVFQNETRLGPIKNFEKCLKISTGDLIFFSDQDDVWDKSKIEKMVSFGGEADLLYSDATIIDEDDDVIYESEIADFQLTKPVSGHNYLYFIVSNCVSGHNIMISRRLAESIKSFPAATMYDQFLSFAASLQSGIDYIDERLCYHRIHKNNFMNNRVLREKSGLKRKKLKINEKNEKSRELFDCIEISKNNDNCTSLLISHFTNYKKIFFDYKLFKELLLRKSEMYPGESSLKQLKKIFNFCKGSKWALFG